MSNSKHIVCPHCNATNRLDVARLKDQPKCGKCHKPLFTAQPLVLSSTNFGKHINNSDIPLVIDFWAPWCGPCKMMAPAFEVAAKTLEPHVRLAKLDTEKEQAIGGRFNIRSIPTLVLFRNGKEVARQAGAMSEKDIVRWVRSKL